MTEPSGDKSVETAWRISLKGNADRGVNRALSMENLYGTADHLWFRSRKEAEAVAIALAAAGYPCGIAAETGRDES